MGLVVLVASAVSMRFVVQGWLGVPIQGSVPLFLCGAALHVFAVTSLGMFLATFARTMPQFALLMILVLLPLQMLSGGMTPRESMPEWVQQVMLAAPTTHFVMLSQGILFRGGGSGRRLAAVPRPRRHRHGSLRRRPRPLPQDHRDDGVTAQLIMDSTIVTAIAAVSGSLVGATATIITTWITQRTQMVRAEKKRSFASVRFCTANSLRRLQD